ncbi:MAG: YgiT-type zinc finger protein [Cyanobacteria bacterium J06598_3]
MFQDHACGSENAHPDQVSEVFNINGKLRLVENIPAQVCNRCGEEVFN